MKAQSNLQLALLSMILLVLLGGCSWCEKKVYVPVKIYYEEPTIFDNYTCSSPTLPEGNITSQEELMGYFAENYLLSKKYEFDCKKYKLELSNKRGRIKELNKEARGVLEQK